MAVGGRSAQGSPVAVSRAVVGQVARPVARRVQWRRPTYRVVPIPAEACPHQVARHATPLVRRLPGVDLELQLGKVANLRLAAGALDGLGLPSGRTLSFWREVGRPTASRGFLDGLVLRGGGLTAGTGGGLCQATNLLYWLTLHTPLVVVERHRHSYDVFPDDARTQPFGSGATCAWPSADLQVSNPTDATYRLALTVTDDELVGSWWCDRPAEHTYEVYETGHAFVDEAPGVRLRCNVLRRRATDAQGRVVLDEVVAENRARVMY